MTQIQVLSVQQLLNHIRQDNPEGWVLPLAQRAFVWRDTQITRLVDSLLKGFPVGSVLLSEAMGPHFELKAKGTRKAEESLKRRIHLLDGQQRSLSLQAAFGGAGWVDPRSGRRNQLWVNLTELYPDRLYDAFNPNHSDHAHRFHLRWLDEEETDPNQWNKAKRVQAGFRMAAPKTPEKGWVRLSDVVKHPRRTPEAWWSSWSPKAPLPATTKERMSLILTRIQKAWKVPCIPIHELDPEANSPQELFQIFIRLNSAGTPLGAAEQFFAGVKQHWVEAEERLDPLVSVAGPLKRRDLITLVARAAAKVPLERLGLPRIVRKHADEEVLVGDPIPIRLERLAKAPEVVHPETGDKHNLLILKMDALTREDGPLSLEGAMRWVYDAFYERMYLGILGLSSVSWSAAVAWVLGSWSRTGMAPEPTDAVVDPLLRFCFWTSNS